LRSPQLTVLAAATINTACTGSLLFEGGLTLYAKPDSRDRLAACLRNSAVTFFAIGRALTLAQLASSALHLVFNAGVNLILNGAIP
jgi:hypothetical protein